MATVSAPAVATTDSLETFRQGFNTLRSDIQALTFESTIVFEGATANDFETSLTVVDPTADRTITLPDRSDTVALLGDIEDKILLNGTDSSGTDSGDELLLDSSSPGVDVGEKVLQETATSDPLLNRAAPDLDDVLLESSSATRKNFLLDEVEAVRIEFEDATSDNLLGSLFVPPATGGIQFTMPASDGLADQVLGTDGAGNLSFVNQSSGLSLSNDGNNRVITATGSNSGVGEANLLFDGSTLAVTGNITATTITLSNDAGLLVPNDGNIRSASANDAMQISSAGIVTFKEDIIIKDAGTIGSASDTDAISISSGGVVNISATTASTGSTSGALTVAGGMGVALDLGVGDDLRLDSDGAVISFGENAEVTLTHVHNTGLLLSDDSGIGTTQLQFGDSGTYIQQSADGVLELFSDTTMELNADAFRVKNTASNETMISADANGEVALYYNNVEIVATRANSLRVYGTSSKGAIKQDSAGLFIVLDGTDASGSNAGDNVIIEDGGTDGSGTNAGDDILHEDYVFLHTGLQREVLEIRASGGNLLKSLSGFAEGAI